MVKKPNGDTVIVEADDSVVVLDKDGHVKGKEDPRFKLILDLSDKTRVVAMDPTKKYVFQLKHTDRLERMKEQL